MGLSYLIQQMYSLLSGKRFGVCLLQNQEVNFHVQFPTQTSKSRTLKAQAPSLSCSPCLDKATCVPCSPLQEVLRYVQPLHSIPSPQVSTRSQPWVSPGCSCCPRDRAACPELGQPERCFHFSFMPALLKMDLRKRSCCWFICFA